MLSQANNATKTVFHLFIIFLAGTGLFMNQQAIGQDHEEQEGEVRRGVFIPAGDTASFWVEQRQQRLIRQLEPTGKASPTRIGQYIEKYKSLSVFDHRVIAFQVKGVYEKRKIILTGMVSYPEQKEGLLQALESLKLTDIEDRIEVLPSAELGEYRYAIAIVPNVPFYSQPTGRPERLTESLFGDSIFLLKGDKSNGYYFAQHANGYLGWIKKDDIKRIDLNQFRQWRNRPRALFRQSYPSAEFGILIPIGAELPLDESGKIILPQGDVLDIPDNYYHRYELKPSNRALELLESAKSYLGTSYVWGGITEKGVDCSGFVQSLYRAYGINLARDADQQFLTGDIVGWRGFTEDLLPGDLLYFVGRTGRISHTAIYVGDGKYIHAQSPDVHYTSFRPDDPDYDERTNNKFVLAKRVIRGE